MLVMKALTLGVSLVLLAGCDGYRKDVETVCNVRARVKVPPKAEPAEEAELIKAYLFENIHSPKAKKVFLTLGSMSDSEKLAVLRRETGATGVSSCPLADEAEAALKAVPPAPPPAAPARPSDAG